MLQELYDVTYVCNGMHSVHELGLPVMHCTISACCGCSVTISIIVLLTILEYTFSLFHTCNFNCSMLRAGFLNMDAGGSYIAVA